jgi:CelD/BcsL family acetyltransferase involved in cellulose biosynthesis
MDLDETTVKNTLAAEIPRRVTVENLDMEALSALRHGAGAHLPWTCPFVLPPWLSAWWRVFGGGAEPLIAVVRNGSSIIGVAPLMIRDGTVRFLGDPDVCDYFDCPVVPGQEPLFFGALMDHLKAKGLQELDLGPVRPESAVLGFFSKHESLHGCQWSIRPEDVSLEVDLPATWEEFLNALDAKQRHEIRRKLRRLNEAGSIRFRSVRDASQIPDAMGTFLDLFTMNRNDKAAFLTDRMESFFRTLALGLAGEGLLDLSFLELDGQPVASVFCFDLQGTRYLYNNGYDGAYRDIGVGLMSKVLSLEAAIDEGLRTYNFLRGDEEYKYRLGGKEIPLSRCRMTLCGGTAAGVVPAAELKAQGRG